MLPWWTVPNAGPFWQWPQKSILPRAFRKLRLKARGQAAVRDPARLLVHFALGIKPAHRCVTQRSDRGEMRARDVVLLGKFLQPGINLVALVEDDGVLLGWLSRVQQLHLHLRSFARRNRFRGRHIFVCRILRSHHHGANRDQYECAAQSLYFSHGLTPALENLHKWPSRSARPFVSASSTFNSIAGAIGPKQRRSFLPAAP